MQTWVGLISAIAGFLVVKVFDLFSNKTREHSKAIVENTVAITELKVEIRHLNERLIVLYRLRQDVDAAHSAIRDLRNSN